MTLARKTRLGSSDKDVDLVDQSIAGDPEAFRQFYRRYVGRVRSTLARLAEISHLDDMTQETFVNIWRNLPKLKSTACVSSWVYRVSVNVAMDHHRQKQKRTFDVLPEEVPSTIDEARAIECRQLVSVALATLDFSHRTVVVLHDLEQLTEREISNILEIPCGTVKSRLFNARAKVRTFLQNNGGQHG